MLEPFSGQHAPYASDLECLTLIIKEYSANLNQIFAESFFRPIEDSKMFDETMFRKLSTRAPPKKQQQLSRQQTFDIYQSIGQQLEMHSERLRSQKITLFSLMVCSYN
jgi:hypothetical protein